VREIRQLEQQGVEARGRLLHEGVEGLDAVGDLAHPRHGRLRILAAPLGLADHLGGAVALGLQLLRLRHEAPALGVGIEHGPERDLSSARRERALHRRGILTDQPDVEHRNASTPHPCPLP
jgi:hypothetical protein